MENKEKLEKLKTEIKLLQPIVSKSFEPFTGEFEKYREGHILEFEKYYSIRSQIRQLEWDLMTPEQQARDLEVRRQIRLKTGQIKEGEE